MVDDLDRLFDEIGGRTRAEAKAGRNLAPAQTTPLRNEPIALAVWVPAIEVLERDGGLVIRAELAGTDLSNIRVAIEGDALVIEGERPGERDEGCYLSERRYGPFRRTILLPERADADRIEAKFDNGILEVSIPVNEGAPKGHNIPIQCASGGGSHRGPSASSEKGEGGEHVRAS
jgi:HSP20 family protein